MLLPPLLTFLMTVEERRARAKQEEIEEKQRKEEAKRAKHLLFSCELAQHARDIPCVSVYPSEFY